MQERLPGGERPGQQERVAVAERLVLHDEVEPRGVRPGGGAVGRLVAGGDDEADLLGPGADRLVEDDLQRLLLDPVAVHEGLQREPALARPAAVMTALVRCMGW